MFLINDLNIRNAISSSSDINTELASLRADIDIIDDKLFEILSNRMDVVEEIGNFKKKKNITILQVTRWEEIMRKRIKESTENHLNELFPREPTQVQIGLQ